MFFHAYSLPRLAVKPTIFFILLGSIATPTLYGSGILEAQAPSLEQRILDLQTEWHAQQNAGEVPELHLHITAERIRAALCAEGKTENCPPEPQKPKIIAKNVDIERLAYAVAIAETSNCTAGTGKSRNNCHGIKFKKGGFRVFESPEHSYDEFMAMWLRVYGDRFPTLADAKRYSGSEGTHWLRTVTIAYNQKGEE